jgi:multidrug resistance efflux pump
MTTERTPQPGDDAGDVEHAPATPLVTRQDASEPEPESAPVTLEDEAAPNAEPLPGNRGNPAKKIAALLVVVLAVFVSWYAVSDRLAPYSSRGTVSAYVAQIAPRVAGQVTEVFVEDNTIVDQDEPLFQLDRRPFELAVRQAEVGLAQAVQATDASAAAIASSQARVSQARASLENARTAANRTASLFERGVVAQAEADLQSALLQLGKDGGASNPQIMAAQLQLEQAQLNLLYSTVTAPTRGVVTNLQLAIGQFAAAGSPVMTFFDSRGAWITADLRENQIGNIEPGDEVEILFDAMPGQTFRGRVHSIAWGIDPGRTSAGGLMQNRPENQWFEPARRMPVHIELEGGMQAWPLTVKAGAKVSVVVYAGGTGTPISGVASTLLKIQSWLSYLY